MAITIDEKVESRPRSSGASAGVELIYTIQGSEDDDAILDLLETTAPTRYAGLYREACRVEPLGAGLWTGTAQYVQGGKTEKTPPEVGDSSWSFDTGGGTQHITQSIETISMSTPTDPDATPDNDKTIGDMGDRVVGIDINWKSFNFSETHYKADTEITEAYVKELFRLTGRTNNSSWRGFDEGEVLFLGASGSKRGDEDWELGYRFAANPNKTDVDMGHGIIIPIVRGWEYVWVRYQREKNDATEHQKQTSAYVERVYYKGDFANLRIGA